MATHYDTLGVPKDATPDDIKQAFRRKAKAHHPDREGGSVSQMALVNKAYDTLGDEDKRKRYDSTGSSDAPPTIEQEATARLAQLFAELLGAEVADIVPTACSEVAKFFGEAGKARKRLDHQVVRLTKVRDKVRTKSGVNMFHTIVDGQIKDAELKIREVVHAIAVMSHVRSLLEDYESDPPPPQESDYDRIFKKFYAGG